MRMRSRGCSTTGSRRMTRELAAIRKAILLALMVGGIDSVMQMPTRCDMSIPMDDFSSFHYLAPLLLPLQEILALQLRLGGLCSLRSQSRHCLILGTSPDHGHHRHQRHRRTNLERGPVGMTGEDSAFDSITSARIKTGQGTAGRALTNAPHSRNGHSRALLLAAPGRRATVARLFKRGAYG